MSPNRDKSSDGTIGDAAHAASKSEHNPDANGIVRAMDISNDPAHGVDSQKLADALVASRDPRILYVISNRRICSSVVSPWIWRSYNGSNPHNHHVHLSVVSDPAKYDDTKPWALPGFLTAPVQPVGEQTSGGQRFIGITATEFGGSADPNTSAYDGHLITDQEFGVALPFKFKSARPHVRVFKDGKSVVCQIVDVGPWNTNDPYWNSGGRPQAESGTDNTGRHTNHAGIDLTPAAAKAIGLNGLGKVDWEFVEAQSTTKTSTPIDLKEILKMATDDQMKQLFDAILSGRTPLPTTVAPTVTTKQIAVTPPPPVVDKQPMSFLDQIFGGSLFTGKKTAIGLTGLLATVIPFMSGFVDSSGTLGQVLPTLITLFAGFTGLGLVAKFDRAILIANQISTLLHRFVPDGTVKTV